MMLDVLNEIHSSFEKLKKVKQESKDFSKQAMVEGISFSLCSLRVSKAAKACSLEGA
jgi:hypothetical protein